MTNRNVAPIIMSQKWESKELGRRENPSPLPPLPWRPGYLQRRVLAAFAVVFAALIATAEALLAFSDQHAGLAKAGSSRYIWQYGGTAIIILTSTIWTRAEFQAKLAAPWIRMARGPADAKRTLLVDYITVFQPLSIVQAIKNNDWLVAMLALVSLLLRVLIIVATSIIAPTVVNVVGIGAPINLKTQFADSSVNLQNVGSLPFYSLVGLTNASLPFLDGTSKAFAYQTFDQDEGSRVKVTTDGFLGSLDCKAADVRLDGMQLEVEFFTLTNLTVSASDCEAELSLSNTALMQTSTDDGVYILQVARAKCGGSEAPEDQRMAAVMAEIVIDFESISSDPGASKVPFDGRLTNATAILCKPTYSITRVQVEKNGTDVLSVLPVQGSPPRTLGNVSPVDILNAHDVSFTSTLLSNEIGGGGLTGAEQFFNSDETIVDINQPMAAAMQLRIGAGKPPTIDDLKDMNYLRDMVVDYYEEYTAIIAALSLLEDANIPTTGTSTVVGDRLVVRSLPVHLGAALLAACFALTVSAAFLTPKNGILPRAANSVMDVAALVAHSRPLLQSLRGTGAADMSTIKDRLKDCKFHTTVEPYERPTDTGLGYFRIQGGNPPPQDSPSSFNEVGRWGDPIALHRWARLAAVVAVVAIVAALEILLRKSTAENGLFDITGAENIVFVSAVLAIILGLVAMYYQAADNDTRVLAPYVALRQGDSFPRSVGLDFLDMSRPRIFWHAIRGRNVVVAATGMTVMLAGILAVFVSGLYVPVPVELSSGVTLQTLDYFSNSSSVNFDGEGGFYCESCRPDKVVASLILRANLSYPRFTYEDLAFQRFEIADPEALAAVIPDDRAASEMVVSVTLPAIRPKLSCRVHPPSEVVANLTLNGYSILGDVNPLRLDIATEKCNDDASEGFDHVARLSTVPTSALNSIRESSGSTEDMTFGISTFKSDSLGRLCSDYVYVWGSLADPGTNSTTVTNTGAVACNETLEVVNVSVNFHGPDFTIDPSDPPVVDESSGAPTQVGPDDNLFIFLANVSTTELYDPFFALLTTSRFGVPPGALKRGDEEALQDVAGAIMRQQNIIRTQMVSETTRRVLADGAFANFGVFSPMAPGIDPAMTPEEAVPAVPAVARSKNTLAARRRLTQDRPSTRILQGLLCAILVLSLTAWLLTPHATLPRSPASIGSLTALLSDSNIFGFLPRGAEWMDGEAIMASFKDGSKAMGFQMGWEKVRRRRREEDQGLWGVGGRSHREEERAFAVRVARTGGWGGGEEAGLGIMARVGMGQRGFVRGWRSSTGDRI